MIRPAAAARRRRETMAEELLNSTQVEHAYGGSEIQVLEGLEAVRKDICISTI